MRDQNFQQLMSAINTEPLHETVVSSSSSEVLSAYPVGEAKQSTIEELDSQVAFKQFLKRSLPNRKPSKEFIQSIQDRIKIIDPSESTI